MFNDNESLFFGRKETFPFYLCTLCSRGKAWLLSRSNFTRALPVNAPTFLSLWSSICLPISVFLFQDVGRLGWHRERPDLPSKLFAFNTLMGQIAKCLYISRSLYHTSPVSRPWQQNWRTVFQRFFRVRSSSGDHASFWQDFWTTGYSFFYFPFRLFCFVYYAPKWLCKVFQNVNWFRHTLYSVAGRFIFVRINLTAEDNSDTKMIK